MNEFLMFFDEQRKIYPLYLEIIYSKNYVVCVDINVGDGEFEDIVFIRGNDLQVCFAKAQVELKEWLCNNKNGY